MEDVLWGQLNCTDLVALLASIGIKPQKRKAWNYFYRSPLAGHPEPGATFVVNQRLNRWRETTTKESGDVADLVVRLYDCTIAELMGIVCAAFPAVSHLGSSNVVDKSEQIAIEQFHPIRSSYVERLLWNRRIPLHVARNYCLEARYKHRNNLYQALSFTNDHGGFELFDTCRHYRVPPYGPTHFRNQSDTIIIVRHVFDLLSYIALLPGPIPRLPDYLVLNDPLLFPTVQQIIAPYRYKLLLLPNDAAGIAFSAQAVNAFPHCHDHRSLYAGYPTLNDWICRIGTSMSPKIPASQINDRQLPPNPLVRGKT